MYECCGGGTVDGTLEGDVIYYEWAQPGSQGRGRWLVVHGGDRLEGTWGAGAAESGGGRWDLDRAYR